jgi:hypothetical protein
MVGIVYRIGVGVRLVRASMGVWGTPVFWDTIGWWHNEVHYTIPRLDEERRMAASLELAFSDGVSTCTSGANATNFEMGVPTMKMGSSQIVFKDNRVTVDSVGSDGIGEWQWESVAVRSTTRPGTLRRLLIGALIGGKWVGDEGSKKTPPEYDRLSEFLSH